MTLSLLLSGPPARILAVLDPALPPSKAVTVAPGVSPGEAAEHLAGEGLRVVPAPSQHRGATPAIWLRVGVDSDVDVGRLVGVTSTTVRAWRVKLGIEVPEARQHRARAGKLGGKATHGRVA